MSAIASETGDALANDDPIAIDWVSPLPPVASGIADYSADLLPQLAARCRLRVVQLPDQPAIRPGLETALGDAVDDVAVIAPGDLSAAPGAPLPIYQMGNNRYHVAVHDLAMQTPGIVVLHDWVLHHLLVERILGDGPGPDPARSTFADYRAAIVAEHGWLGDAIARPIRWAGASSDAGRFALPAHRRLLRQQRGVIVHSRWAATRLVEDGVLAPDQVAAVAMGIPLPMRDPATQRAASRAFRDAHALPHDRPLLGSFGFQTPIKRTDVAVRALAEPALADAHLLIAGTVSPGFDPMAIARAHGVAERVHLLGFLDYDDFERAIAAVDVCLNLRYPTAGETSASLLRILAVGRPAVVSDFAQFAELPDALVIKVPLPAARADDGAQADTEVAALAARVGALLADDAARRSYADRARAHIAARHAPADAADAVLTACRTWLRPAAARAAATATAQPATVPRATTLLAADFTGNLTIEGADLPWPPGTRRRLRAVLHNRSDVRWLAGSRPEGGVALAMSIRPSGSANDAAGDGTGSKDRDRPWIPLPIDLEPGAALPIDLGEVRRPLGPARIEINAQLMNRPPYDERTRPRWSLELP
ncbi:MAG: glycosyltransferase [Acidobacteriota bacterium]